MGNLVGTLTKIDVVWRRANSIFMLISGGFLMALTFLIGADVLMRYVFHNPIRGASEFTTVLMPYVVFWAFAYTLREGGHVRITLILHRLVGRSRLWAETIARVIGVFFFGLLTYYSWMFFWDSFIVKEIMQASAKIPAYAGKIAMPIGLLLMFSQFLELLLTHWIPSSGITDAGNEQGV